MYCRLSHLSIAHRRRQWAPLHAKNLPLFVDMIQHVIGAPGPHDLTAFITRYAFGSLVPVSDPPISIQYVHAIMEVVENALVENAFIYHESPSLFTMHNPKARARLAAGV